VANLAAAYQPEARFLKLRLSVLWPLAFINIARGIAPGILSSFIWSVADLLRGDYKQSEYGRVILPFTVLRRLDCVLEPTKGAILKEKEKREAAGINPEPFLLKKSGQHFYNTSPLDMRKLLGDQDNIGQELNRESYAICKADMLIKGQDVKNIILGNTLSDDGLAGQHFDHSLSNPPFGVEWKKIQKSIEKEHTERGFDGRFGPGLPRVSDGSLLFLMHLISKMRPSKDGGGRFGIVLNGSPLFTGSAGSGESEIRRYVLENDLLEAIIGLPTDMFYNTGISTYVWIVTNRKPTNRKGKVQLIDASAMWQKMRKSLGSKRKELSAEHIDEITKIFGDAKELYVDPETGKKVKNRSGSPRPAAGRGAGGEGHRGAIPISRIFKNEDFGYRTITVERPERDAKGNIVKESKGKRKGEPKPDSSLRDTENVPLSEDIETYFEREVLPHVPDAWIDHDKTKVGYEIPFNRHFYVFKPPRELAEIDTELKGVTDRIVRMIGELSQ